MKATLLSAALFTWSISLTGAQPSNQVDVYGDPLPPGAVGRMGTVRFRNPGPVGAVACSPDGRRIAATGARGFRIWDRDTGRELFHCPVRELGIISLAWSPDGKLIASGGGDNLIRLWDAGTGQELRQLKGHQGKPGTSENGVAEVIFRCDSKALMSFGKDNTIRLWKVAGTEIRQFKGHVAPVQHIALSSDGRTLAAFLMYPQFEKKPGEARLWEVETGKPIARWPMPGDVGVHAFSPDLRILATRNQNELPRDLRLWDLTSGKHIRSLPEAGWAHFTSDGKTIVASGTGHLRFWDVQSTTEITCVPRAATGFSSRYTFTPDMKTLVGFGSNALRFWDTTTGDEIRRFEGHDKGIGLIAYSPDGRLLATADSYELCIWDVASRKLVHRLSERYTWWRGMSFSADSSTLTAWSPNRVIQQWDLATGQPVEKIADRWGTTGSIDGVVLLPGEKSALVAERQQSFPRDGGKLAIWDTQKWQRLRVWDHDLYFLQSPVVSPDGATLFAGGNQIKQEGDRSVMVGPKGLPKEFVVYRWDIGMGKELTPIGKHVSPVQRLVLSPDGRTLAAATTRGPIHLWATATGFLRLVIDPDSRAAAMAFSPDARYLAVAYDNNPAWFPSETDPTGKKWTHHKYYDHIRIWDLFTGQEVHRFGKHGGAVASIAFSPDGKVLASGSSDTTALLWDMNIVHEKSRLPVIEADVEVLWKDLMATDGGKAYRAMWGLTAIPKRAVPFLTKRVHPIQEVEPKRMERLLAELSSDQFSLRQKANRELENLGVAAKPALRRALAKRASEEFRRRAEQLLMRPEEPVKTEPLRIVEVLEHIATAEALEYLGVLAKGVPDARLTQEAQASVQRLNRRLGSRQ